MLALLAVFIPVAALVFLQRNILFPRPKSNIFLESDHHVVHETVVPVEGTALRAFHAIPKTGGTQRALLYFCGRLENPTMVFRCLNELPDHHVLCFYYRNLGPSLAKPGEAQLVQDGLAVLDWLSAEHGIAAFDITVCGRSLGSGIAVQVAGARPVRQLILVSPYDRLHHVVRRRFPFILPFLLKDSYRSDIFIHKVRCRCMSIVGAMDKTVPPALTRKLFNDWRGDLTEISIEDCGHRGLLRRENVHRAFGAFCA